MKTWFLSLICYLTALTLHASPLPAEEVFRVRVNSVDPNTFAVHFQIKPDYFLYSDRIQLIPKPNSAIHLGTIRLPPTTNKTDKQGHVYRVYRNQISIPVGILGDRPGETLLELHYQGCSDDGFCYAPETKTIVLAIDDHLGLTQASLQNSATALKSSGEYSQNERITKVFAEHNWLMILLIFYGFGVLLSFTPCILPMIPVLSGIIIGHSKTITTRKAFFLSLSYVLSMSITYAILGAVVALLGANLQISMQSPWSIGLFSLIFILLALSMFGFYEFKLPHSWQAKIHGTSLSQKGGHYLSAAVMGCLSTLILSPCVTAPLIGVLSYIAQTGNVLLGCIILFILGLGMGTPLLLIGTSAGKWLPQTGSWMNLIKAFFGILFIAIAIDLIARIAPPLLSMTLWASLLIFSGIYCGALTYSVSHREKFNQSIGLILLLYGFLILVGASMGATNPLQPLRVLPTPSVLTPSSKEQSLSSIMHSITKAQGKPIMLDFYADWCTSCKVMEATTFKDPEVQKTLSHFAVIKIDITKNTTETQRILHHFQVIAPPTFVFFNAEGKELHSLRLVGEIPPDIFLKTLNQVQ